jgi:hypothetical protein
VQTCFFSLAKNAAQSVWATVEKNLAACAVSTYYYNLLEKIIVVSAYCNKINISTENVGGTITVNCSAPVYLSLRKIQDKLCLLFEVMELILMNKFKDSPLSLNCSLVLDK